MTNNAEQKVVRDLRERLDEQREALRDGYFQEGASSGRAVNAKVDRRRELKGHFGKVYSLHWAGQGSDQVVSASQDGKLIVWNANSTNKLNAIPLKTCWVMSCAFEQDENDLVACGGLDNIVSVYRLSRADPTSTQPPKELVGHDGYVSSCRFVGKNNLLSSSGDGSCRYWDVSTGTCLNYFKEHMGDVMCVSPQPMSRHVFVSASVDLECKLWDIRTGAKHVGKSAMMRSPSRGMPSSYGNVDEVEGDPVGSSMTYQGHESDVNAVTFFPDGTAFGTGSDDASCRLFDIRCHQEVNSFRHSRILCGITSVAFSSSGRVLFGGYDDFSCIGWDTLNNPAADSLEAQPAVTLRKHENRVSCVGVHSNGQALATGSWDTFIKIWA